MSRKEFCDKYEIPYRTMEDWEAGKSRPVAWAEKLLRRVVEENKTPKEEIKDAFQTVGIIIRAKMEEYANSGNWDGAFALEDAYRVINRHFDCMLAWDDTPGEGR